jgi:hypothetical protein
MLKEAFLEKDCEVEFISCVPDYCSFLNDDIDPWFANFAKEDNTKLQFHFKKISDKRYPIGVAMTYRAFCQEKVFLIFKRDNIPIDDRSPSCNEIKHQAMRATILQEPWNERTQTLCPSFILERLPSKSIVAAELVPDSRKILDAVMSLAVGKWGIESSQAKSYAKFEREIAPKSNSVLEYIESHPQKYPKSFGPLFINPGAPIVDNPYDLIVRSQRKRVRDEDLLEIITTDSVTRRDNQEWKSPYIFCKSGLPVIKRKSRSKKQKQGTPVEVNSDLLAPRTYEFMSNRDLVMLIKSINTQFDLNIKYTGKKDILIQRVKEAVALALAKHVEVTSAPVVIESDSSGEDENGEDCYDE